MPRRKRNQQNQFRSYYCDQCYQAKPCKLLTSSVDGWKSSCCNCYYQWEKEKCQKRLDFTTNLAREKENWLITNQKLIILKNYSGCTQCGSYEVNEESLEQGKIVCQPCWKAKLKKLKPYEFAGYGFSWAFWYQICKLWKVNLNEWMEKYHVHPVDFKCAEQWLTNPHHLPPNCSCFERKARETAELFSWSWERLQKQIKNCSCQASPKVRVDFYDSHNYGYTYCENCEKRLDGGGKTGVIKNRNDPQFWGLQLEKRILCLECMKNDFLPQIRGEKRKTLHRYLKRGYI